MCQLLDDLELYLATNTRVTSAKTIKHYRICFRQFVEHTGATCPQDVNDANIVRFLRICGDIGLAPHTVCQKFDYLRAYATDRAKRGQIAWLTISAPRRPQIVPSALSTDDLRNLFVEAKATGPWWHALVYWFWCTAERTSATLHGARWSGLSGDVIVIDARWRKGRHRAASYVLPGDLLRSIDAIRTTRDEIFYWPKSLSSFYNAWKALYERAGLRYVPHKTGPHQLRRSHASHLEAAGGNATESLGHSSRRVTVNSYLDPRIVRPRPYSNQLPRVS